MTKVITYGTYDLLHYGHIKLLERAKLLGDYLIVGVTADDFDKTRGKINVQQSLMERVAGVQATGLADEVIIEEYEGQKIDDIQKYAIDVFAIGSDWEGHFDYLNDYCRVIYLPRTEGISSSIIRSHDREIVLGVYGDGIVTEKCIEECKYVNGVRTLSANSDFQAFVEKVDAVYIYSHPANYYKYITYALEHKKHVLCEMPLTQNAKQAHELFELAEKKGCVLSLACKTAYSTAYNRMLLLVKGGIIGDVVSIDSTCTSIRTVNFADNHQVIGCVSSLNDWGPTALLPVFQLLGVDYGKKEIISRIANEEYKYDEFTKCNFVYPSACASISVGKGVKSEGCLIISGTKGYIYVPAPWWKTDYFEVRYENAENNRRSFYQLEGEGTRYEIVAFVKSIQNKKMPSVSKEIGIAISQIMEDFLNEKDVTKLMKK